ncbi:hypothetical protein CEUSTIGMA_g220.t1 [Chlamydomonas eustigma]|uniref:FAST kinase leucine-rich domain-containing protein n=1 Tax=Chlamydomonas eustigma TaxID=1157962 RepID=A0A250WPJ1_9CHLO|nr:hypothetical protein CEUSTIGMA_g220.t1 [Chlamydomonas eustigma]|eukprot:GAX72764.1 hypothetical protein CEUSTIGMA_g220.t1 [Chlamydomonas eustigma]
MQCFSHNSLNKCFKLYLNHAKPHRSLHSRLWKVSDSDWADPDFDADVPSTSEPVPSFTLAAVPTLRQAPNRAQRAVEQVVEVVSSSPMEPLPTIRTFESKKPEQLVSDPVKHVTKKPRMAKSTPGSLEVEVKSADAIEQIGRLLQKRPLKSLSGPEIVLFCNQLAKITTMNNSTVRGWRESHVLLNVLLKNLEALGGVKILGTYELIVLIAALARLRHTPTLPWLGTFFTVIEGKLKDCGTGNLTMLIRAVSKLEMDAWDIKAAPGYLSWMSKFEQRVLSRMGACTGEELVRILASCVELKHKPSPEWMSAFTRALLKKLPSLEPQILAQSMLAFTQLNYQPDKELVKAYYLHVYSKLPMFDDHDLANVSQAMNVLRRIIKQDFLSEFLDEILVKLPGFSTYALSNLLVALTTATHKGRSERFLSLCRTRPMSNLISSRWLEEVASRVQEQMWSFSGDGLSDTVWSLSQLGYVPTASFMKDCVAASHTKLFATKNNQMIRMFYALGSMKYLPNSKGELETLDCWYKEAIKLASRREYDVHQMCNFISAISKLPPGSPHGLLLLKHKPDFGFMHNFAQACRYVWNSFTPQGYADLMAAMVFLACPMSVDPMWLSEFLAIIQCKLHIFPPTALCKLLPAVRDLPGIRPGAEWLAIAVGSVDRNVHHYNGPQMCKILVALSQYDYRPPADVFDRLMKRLEEQADQLTSEDRSLVSESLTVLLSGYLSGTDGHEQYSQLQLKLRAQEVPASVLLHPRPPDYPALTGFSDMALAVVSGVPAVSTVLDGVQPGTSSANSLSIVTASEVQDSRQSRPQMSHEGKGVLLKT